MNNSRACIICGKPTGKNRLCCSRACYSLFRSHKRQCAVCGNWFFCPPSSEKVCCSHECSSLHRAKLCKSGALKSNTEKMLKARNESKNLKPGPQNTHAKTWTISAPDGKIYTCRNLLHFFREHRDLLGDATPRQACDGIIKVKASMLGKRKNKSFQWRGWKLLHWNDE